MKTASQKHAELKTLSKKSQQSIYDMLRLANEILSDHEYVDKFGGESHLIDMFEADEFAHFGGSPTVAQLLRAYRHNPDRRTWEEHRYNVWAMIDLASPSAEGEERVRINWKALAKELEVKLAAAEAVSADQKRTISELRERCDSLAADASEMRGKVTVLESLLSRRAVA